MFLLKAALFLFRLVQPSVATWVNARHIIFPGQTSHQFAQTLPSHSILLDSIIVKLIERFRLPNRLSGYRPASAREPKPPVDRYR
jgi:hypothetical protein